MNNSYFDGKLRQEIGISILSFLIIVVSLGILTPWAVVIRYNWQIKHTVIEGKRLAFDGTALGLFGNWIKWFFLTIITLGIYGFWLNIKIMQWKTSHTYFEEPGIRYTESVNGDSLNLGEQLDEFELNTDEFGS